MNDSTLVGKERHSPSDLAGLLEGDRAWLETQFPQIAWHKARALVADTIKAWIDQCGRTRWGRQLATDETAAYGALAGKIWTCWKFHWQEECRVTADGRVDGMNVGQRIRAGEGLRGGNLGGDVIDDLIWADGVLRGDQRAIASFIDHFDRYAEAVVRQVSPRSVGRMDWWDELRTDLMCRDGKPGKLASFRGDSGLAPWLRRIFIREIIRSTQTAERRPAAMDAFPGIADARERPPDEVVARRECRDLVREALRTALESLTETDQQSLTLSFVERFENQTIAEIQGISPGNASRRREKAMKRLREHLSGQLQDGDSSLATCLSQLLKLSGDESVLDLLSDGDGDERRPRNGLRDDEASSAGRAQP